MLSMAGFLGTKASIEFELNLLLQKVILIIVVVGYWFARNIRKAALRCSGEQLLSRNIYPAACRIVRAS